MVRCQNQKKMEQVMKRTLQKTLRIRRLILQNVMIPQVLFTDKYIKMCPGMCAVTNILLSSRKYHYVTVLYSYHGCDL